MVVEDEQSVIRIESSSDEDTVPDEKQDQAQGQNIMSIRVGVADDGNARVYDGDADDEDNVCSDNDDSDDDDDRGVHSLEDVAWYLFVMQCFISVVAILFGIALTFFTDNQTVGVSLILSIVTLWLQSPTDTFFTMKKHQHT